MATPEYVDDVPYVRHLLADLSPQRLRLGAALNGIEPPSGTDFDYCELGCAHGDTLVALAAAHPDARFLGVDLSADHIATAKRLARDGALENIGFLARDFGDLVAEDLGEFDYIVAHGVLSWVSPDKRAALIAFARAKLKPGGLLYVSYNAMPGWASVEPLRQLLLFPSTANAAVMKLETLERARLGVDFALKLEANGAEYFTRNPSASEMLRTMTKAGLPYVVHEYMHEHWTPMYFARVAWEMAATELSFAGTLPPSSNFRDASLPEALERELAPVTDRVTFESLKDFALNEFFRRDLYVLAPRPSSPATTSAYLDTTTWGSLDHAMPKETTAKLSHRAVPIDAPAVQALLASVIERSATLEELAERPELATFGIERLRAALLKLIVTEHVVPMQCAPRPRPPTDATRFVVPSPYNQMMLRQLAADMPVAMTSVPAGMALRVSRLEALALRVFTEIAGSGHEAWVRDHVGRSVLRLRVGDRVVEDPHEQERLILDTIEALRTNRLAKLVELGILAPVSL
jgi:SAM-dependent methyltransferase